MPESYLEALRQHPAGRVALVDDDGQLTYGELRHNAARLARRFREAYGEGRFVMVKAGSTNRFVQTLVGVCWSGNTAIPVDPELPPLAVDELRKRSRAVAVVDPARQAPLDGLDEAPPAGPEHPLLVMFTSGTTGVPKGVIITDGNLVHSCRAVAGYLDYHRHRSAAVVLPLHYSYALLSQVLCLLYIGGRIRLFSDFKNPFRLVQEVAHLELETLCGVPSTFAALTLLSELRPFEMPGIRVLCSAGAAMNQGLFGAIKRIFPRATLFNNYGMTEAAPRIAYLREDDGRFLEGSCGRPIDGVEVKVVDPHSHEPVAVGERGMLVVRGPNITPGYLNDPARTQRAFTAEGFLISGDLAHLDEDGYIYIFGRSDDIFNVGGEKVSALEIERPLNEHPAVGAAAVGPVADELRGCVPVAYLQLVGETSRQDLVEHLGRFLPGRKQPVRFLRVDGFPTTSNGKVQRSRLDPGGSYVRGEIR